MATYSVNQSRQLYVVTKTAANLDAFKLDATEGVLAPATNTAGKAKAFVHRGKGGVTRTDIINNVITARATSAAEFKRLLCTSTITLDAGVNGGAPIVAQTYILKLNFRPFIGMGDLNTYNFVVGVTAKAGDTKEILLAKLAQLIVANQNKLGEKLIKVELTGGAGDITNKTKAEIDTIITGGAIGTTDIKLTAAEPTWKRGIKSSKPITFEVLQDTVRENGIDIDWATINTKMAPIPLFVNGKEIADLEYFCMGERGDQYRGMGYPNVIETEYMVDPTKYYDVIDIHYAFVDAGVGVLKSERTLTLVCATEYDDSKPDDFDHTFTNSVITAVNAELGTNIAAIRNA